MTILMYHKVFLDSPTMWWVNVDNFYRQMLDIQNKKVVYLDDYNPINPDLIVITFDGVYKNVLDYALPILDKFNYPFELFISSDYIGINNSFDVPEPLASFVDIEDLKLMVARNGRLQWHTRSHPDLTNDTNADDLLRELEVPDDLQKLDDKGFKWFAYPYGKFNETVLKKAKEKFHGAVSCHQGNGTDIYQLNRVTVTNETTFKKATVAVIIPSYNYGAFLAEAVESVLRQTRKPDEILITDDASTDNTFEIANFFQAQYPHLIKVNRNEENLGIVKNFNKGVSLTTSDYITFLGADNRFRSDYIEKTATILDIYTDVGIAYSDYALFGARAKLVYDNFPEKQRGLIKADKFFIISYPDFNEESKRELLTVGNFIHGSSMYRRQAFNQVGGYVENSNTPEDYNLFLRMIKAGWNAKRVPFPILEYRQHSKEQANIRLTSFSELQIYKELNEALRIEVQQLHLKLQKMQIEQAASSNYLKPQSHSTSQSSHISINVPLITPHLKDDERPLWSVMIPTYNPHLEYLEKTLISVLEQDLGVDQMQIEVVDDRSTQNDPEELVRKVGQGRVSFYRQPKNLGLIGNWNACISRADGHLVHILHQDDVVKPGFYRRLQVAFEQEPSIGAAFCRYFYTDEKGCERDLSLLERETPGIIPNWIERIAVTQRIECPSIVVKREVYEKLGGFCQEAHYAADWEMWKRIAAYYSVWYEPELLACYRSHSSSETSRLIKSGANIADTLKAIEISQSYLPTTISTELSNQARENCAFKALNIARHLLSKGDVDAAIAQIREGIKSSQSSNTILSVLELVQEIVRDSYQYNLLPIDALKLFLSAFQEAFQKQEAIALIESLKLRETNFIIFPDWSQPEDLLYQDLASAMTSLMNHPDRNQTALLIDRDNLTEEEATLFISGVVMNLVMEEGLDVADELEISLVGQLNEMQWEVLSSRINARIVLEHENQQAIAHNKVEKIPTYEIPSFSELTSVLT